MGLNLGQLAQPRHRVLGGALDTTNDTPSLSHLLQHLPHHLMPDASHVEDDSLVAGPRLEDDLLAGDGIVQCEERLPGLHGVESNVWEGIGPAPDSCVSL